MIWWIVILIIALPGGAAGIYLYVRHLVDSQIARFQNDLTQKHCEEVDNLFRQTRGWRHDIKNHLQTMQAYLEMGQLQQLGCYIRELTEDYYSIDISLRTGNAMIDAILNSKLSILRSKEIRVDATAAVPASIPVSDIDLSVMLGNLLDNAMEACLKVPRERRFIRLYMAKAKENLYIYVMNSSDGTYRKGTGGYLSTKLARGHGYGLQRIDKVIRKYKGYRSREDEGNVFVTEVLIPL